MKSNNAITRRQQHDHIEDGSASGIDVDVARRISSSWMDIVACGEHLARMGRGIAAWREAPAAQHVMAAIISDLIPSDAKIMCVGHQAYGWMSAAGWHVTDIMRAWLGKILLRDVIPASAEDCCAMIKKGPMTIVALHAESAGDWNDVRAISAAAVKAGAPLLVLVSEGVDAPQGVAIDRVSGFGEACAGIREACEQVRDQGAIRVIAMDDGGMAAMEMDMMTAAGVNPSDWQDAISKNNDGAEIAANAAYQSPVESF